MLGWDGVMRAGWNEVWRKSGSDGWQDFSGNMEKWLDGKWTTKRISANLITSQAITTVCVLYVCGGAGGSVCKKPAGEQGYPADSRLHFLHSYNTGRQGHIKLSRACSLCYMVTASLHCYMCSSWKRVFSQSMFWSCSWLGSDRRDLFVAGRGFSGFSCPAGVRAVALFKRCLMPYCPPHIASWLFCLFSHWLTGTSVYWLIAQMKSTVKPRLFMWNLSYYCG